MSLQIRSEMPADVFAIAEVTRLAFTYNTGVIENRMIEAFRNSEDFRPDYSVVAVLDGLNVGHGLIAPADLQGNKGNT